MQAVPEGAHRQVSRTLRERPYLAAGFLQHNAVVRHKADRDASAVGTPS